MSWLAACLHPMWWIAVCKKWINLVMQLAEIRKVNQWKMSLQTKCVSSNSITIIDRCSIFPVLCSMSNCLIWICTLSVFHSWTDSKLSTSIMDNSTVLETGGLATQYIEGLLTHFPDNPLSEPFGKVWMSLNQRYTNFQLATFGSIIMHEVRFRKLIVPSDFE